MSLPDKMNCISDHCPTPLKCNHKGECRERAKTNAREYEVAIAEKRKQWLKAWRDRG